MLPSDTAFFSRPRAAARRASPLLPPTLRFRTEVGRGVRWSNGRSGFRSESGDPVSDLDRHRCRALRGKPILSLSSRLAGPVDFVRIRAMSDQVDSLRGPLSIAPYFVFNRFVSATGASILAVSDEFLMIVDVECVRSISTANQAPASSEYLTIPPSHRDCRTRIGQDMASHARAHQHS